MASCKVFYSWQSDLPNSTNRGFIEKALEDAAKAIRNDQYIEVEPVIDRDTVGVPGSPDIASTIFAKIEQAEVFVCDISIINSNSEFRATPNPNVLIELGYAIKALGSERIIMVMNTVFGRPELLPFDLRMRRVITYNIPENATEKAGKRKQLEKQLTVALNTIFAEQMSAVGEIIQPVSIGEQAKIAIENNQSNQEYLTQKFMTDLVEKLDVIAPAFNRALCDQTIIDALSQTIEIGVEFASLAEVIASMNAQESAIAMYKGFESILNRYNTPNSFSGNIYSLAFDFYKFIGHEFFVMFISFLIREERWEIISEILDEDFYVENVYGSNRSSTVPFTYINAYLKSLENRNIRLNSNRISIHSDLINERHKQGELAKIVPMQQFTESDCFLAIRTELNTSKNSGFPEWVAWSIIYLEKTPRYLIKANRAKYAEKLLKPLKMSSVATLRAKMIEIIPSLSRPFQKSSSFWFREHPLGNFNPQSIGSQG